MRLQLVVADFHADPAEFTGESAASLARLPGLEQIGRYARRGRLAADWRAGLAAMAGRPELTACAPAHVAAAALNLPATAAPWFADPVHLTAGMTRVRLHPAGLIRIDAAEAAQLRSSFAAEFGTLGLALQPLFGSLLLLGLGPTFATTQDPAGFLGADIALAPATGPDAAALRRLGAEIEMWLHDHPLKTQRVQQGRLTVNGLWLWGGAASRESAVPVRQRALSLPAGFADDGFAAGLWHLCGAETGTLPATLDDLLADPELQRGVRAAVVVLSAAATGERDTPLQRLDATWFEPALRQLRAGSLARLSVYLGGEQWVLSAAGLRRFWRTARPWWEYFRA